MISYDKKIEYLALSARGYLYFIDQQHPIAVGNSGKVYLHRHIASLMEGRWLDPSEIVHHADGNKLNNDPSNLVVLKSHSEHSRLHQGTKMKKICEVCGRVFLAEKHSNKTCSNTCKGMSKRKGIREIIARRHK